LRSQNLDRRYNICSSSFCLSTKVISLSDNLLTKERVVLDHDSTSLLNHCKQFFLNGVFRLKSLFVRLKEGQERYNVVLRRHISHRVKGTHESKGSLHFTLGNLPMFFEQEKRENSRDTFASKTKC